MKIDSHQHFWIFNSIEYGWIEKGMEILRRDFLPEEFSHLLRLNGFDGSVVIQARQSLPETKWLLELADKHSFIKGVVGWLDLCSSELEEQLVYFSSFGKLKGVRHVIHDEPDDDFMLRDNFQHGLSMLEKFGLTFDLLIFPKHLPAAIKLVRQFPGQPFVLDHISKPLIRENLLEPWKEHIGLLSVHPNICCKLSGMVTEANWKNWNKETFKQYLDVVFSAFGEDRLMVGSDWPVCLLGGEYKNVLDIVQDYIEPLNRTARNKILGENCERFYNLTI
jgi:L-fuconolactonase